MLIEFVGNIFTQPLSKVVSLIDRPNCQVRHHSFGQVVQVLLSNSSADVLIVHLTPRLPNKTYKSGSSSRGLKLKVSTEDKASNNMG